MSDRQNESGVALVLCLLFMLALSVVGASLAVLAETESYSSVNYRLMSQSRYAAESGVHKTINYLLNSYTAPGGAGDPIGNYNMNVSPVTYNGQPVVLSAIAGVASNYPLASAQTAFNAAATGTLTAGGTTVTYAGSATLMSMQQLVAYGAAGSVVVQTWRITGDGSIGGSQSGLVEVSALLEQQTVPAHTYAAFATNNGCGALSFSGGITTDSYDSSNMTKVNGKVVTQASGGNVGSNGNLTDSGGSTVDGGLYTPRTGVGNCKNGSVDAGTFNGTLQPTGGIIQLPQAVTYPSPADPNPLPPTTNVNISSNTTCATAGIAAANCSGSGGVLTLTTGGGVLALGNISVSGGATLHMTAGNYALNSLSLSGGSTLVTDSGPIVITFKGQGVQTPISFSGGSISNATMDPSQLQLIYGGTGSVTLSGGTQSAATVYAPNAGLSLSGGTDFYGSLLGATVSLSGGVKVHYDRHLSSSFVTVGNSMLTSFTWKRD